MKKYIAILGLIITAMLLIVISTLPGMSPIEEMLPKSSHSFETENDSFESFLDSSDVSSLDVEYYEIVIGDISIPLGETRVTDIMVLNATDIVVAVVNITWDTDVVSLVDVDDSSTDFEIVFKKIDSNAGYARLEAYYFEHIGLEGDIIISSMEFEPATEASDGDWCWLNIMESTLWDSTLEVVCSAVDNGIAEIEYNEVNAYITLNHGTIPIDGDGYVFLNVTNYNNVSFIHANISWDPSVVTLSHFDSSIGAFNAVFPIYNNTEGYLKLDAYSFDNPLSGEDIIVGALYFEPTSGASVGDWCWLDFTTSYMWDSELDMVAHYAYNGSVLIVGDDCTGVVSGYVYNDLNGNGFRDGGEPGLSNWPVYLDSILTMTDGNGFYLFTNVCPGSYIIEEDIIYEGWTYTSAPEVPIYINQNSLEVNFGNTYVYDQTIEIDKSVRKACCDTYYPTDVTLQYYEEQWVIFKLVITGTSSFEHVTITDTLPYGLIYNEAYSISHGWPVPSVMGSELIWNLGSKQGMWMETIYFRCDVIDGFCDRANNTVEVRGINSCENISIARDYAGVTVSCEPEEPGSIFLSKLVKGNCEGPFLNYVSVPYGEYVTYKIQVIVNVSEGLLSLSVRDDLPQLDGLVYTNSYVLDLYGNYVLPSEYDFTITDDYLYWNFTYVQPGAYYEIYYCADLIGCDEYENTVNISANIRPCCPEAWIFKEDTAVVDIYCPSGVRMDKKVSFDGETWVDGPIESIFGDMLWFKLNVTNIGFDKVSGVTITDLLPDFLRLKEVIDDANAVNMSVSNQSLTWFFQWLNASESREIIFKVKVIAIGTDENVACVKDCNVTSSWWCDSVLIIIEEGMHVEKYVSTDQENWVKNISVATGDRVYWNINISYYTSDTLVLFNIIVNDTLPTNVTYVMNSAKIMNSNGWEITKNPTIDDSVLTWNVYTYNETETVLENGSWLSIIFATDIGMGANGTLENVVNVTARQCSDTFLYDVDTAVINVSEIINHLPTITSPIPEHNAINVSINPELQVTVDDADDEVLSVVFYNASDDSVIGSHSSVIPPRNVSTSSWNNLDYNSSYSWYVNVSDGTYTISSSVFTFKTGEKPDNNPPDTPTAPSPSNGASNIDKNPWLSVHVSDPDGDSMTVTFYDESDDSVIGTDTCTNDCTASVKWSNLAYSTSYKWYVIVSDGEYEVTSSTWRFSTRAPDVDLDLSLKGGFGITLGIENVGSDAASSVIWSVDVVSRGAFGRINESFGDTITALPSGYETFEKISLFKFGRVTVTAGVTSTETTLIEMTKNAFIFGPLVIL